MSALTMRLVNSEQRLIERYRRLDVRDRHAVEWLVGRLAGCNVPRTHSLPRAVGLPEAAKRLGVSYSHARHLIAEGTFPVPALPRQGRAWHRFSEIDINRYLADASPDGMEAP